MEYYIDKYSEWETEKIFDELRESEFTDEARRALYREIWLRTQSPFQPNDAIVNPEIFALASRLQNKNKEINPYDFFAFTTLLEAFCLHDRIITNTEYYDLLKHIGMKKKGPLGFETLTENMASIKAWCPVEETFRRIYPSDFDKGAFEARHGLPLVKRVELVKGIRFLTALRKNYIPSKSEELYAIFGEGPILSSISAFLQEQHHFELNQNVPIYCDFISRLALFKIGYGLSPSQLFPYIYFKKLCDILSVTVNELRSLFGFKYQPIPPLLSILIDRINSIDNIFDEMVSLRNECEGLRKLNYKYKRYMLFTDKISDWISMKKEYDEAWKIVLKELGAKDQQMVLTTIEPKGLIEASWNLIMEDKPAKILALIPTALKFFENLKLKKIVQPYLNIAKKIGAIHQNEDKIKRVFGGGLIRPELSAFINAENRIESLVDRN